MTIYFSIFFFFLLNCSLQIFVVYTLVLTLVQRVLAHFMLHVNLIFLYVVSIYNTWANVYRSHRNHTRAINEQCTCVQTLLKTMCPRARQSISITYDVISMCIGRYIYKDGYICTGRCWMMSTHNQDTLHRDMKKVKTTKSS